MKTPPLCFLLRSRLVLTSILFLTACGRATTQMPGSAEPGIAITRVNLRSAPSTDYPIVAVAEKATHVAILGHVGNGEWLHVACCNEVGYAAEREIKSLAVIDTGSEKLLPAHRKLLEETGWLEYVEANIHEVRYYDRTAFNTITGLAVGLSEYLSGRRVADVALRDRPLHEQVATVVHEAGHLAGIEQSGQMFDEQHAQAVEKRFRRDLERASISIVGEETQTVHGAADDGSKRRIGQWQITLSFDNTNR